MKILFCPEDVASHIKPNSSMAIISITNPGDKAQLRDGWGAILRVSFADAEYNEEVIKESGNLWSVSSFGFVTKKHALEIREFIWLLDSSIKEIVVHCGAGESRSAAVAMYAAYFYEVKLDGNLTKHNTTVWRLLMDPCAFDELLPKPKPSWLATLFQWVKSRHGRWGTGLKSDLK